MKPVAYCINLDKKPDNIERIYKDWSKYLDIKRIPAMTGVRSNYLKAGQVGCRLSHLKLFNDFLNLDAPYFIVMEDDVYQTSNFTDSIWNEILTFINTKDDSIKWDFITLDPFICYENDKNNFTKYSDIFLKIDCFRSMGMIIYNGNFFKNNLLKLKVLEASSIKPIDILLTFDTEFIKLTPTKLLVRQYTDKGSSTSGQNTTSDYNAHWDKTEKVLNEFNSKN